MSKSSDLEAEIRKFEARFERFLAREEELAELLRGFAKELREICTELSKVKEPVEGQKIVELRLKAMKALNQVLLKQSDVEHERSHLLESYGSLMLALEESLDSLL